MGFMGKRFAVNTICVLIKESGQEIVLIAAKRRHSELAFGNFANSGQFTAAKVP